MAYFGQNILQGFSGPVGLKDYRHASKTFTTNGYALAPRTKFLFHVYFTINQDIKGLQNLFGGNNTIGLLVKTAQLPSYQMEVDTLNQYNRKRLVQTKINYQPAQITLHDDSSDLVRSMWYNYYSYYYSDPQQKYANIPNQSGSIGQLQTLTNGFGYQSNDIYAPNRQVNDWGFIGESYASADQNTAQSPDGKPPFFRAITIYGLAQKTFSQYTMINPLISEWQHDTYDYSQGNGTVQHTMTIKYETVKYFSGDIGGYNPSESVLGFADPTTYDTVPSQITRPGATQTVFGQGGIINTPGSVQDLQATQSGFNGWQNVTGGVQQAGARFNSYQTAPSTIYPTAYDNANNVLQGSLPGGVRQIQNSGGGAFFPTPPIPVTGGAGEATNVFIDPNNPGGPGGAGVGG